MDGRSDAPFRGRATGADLAFVAADALGLDQCKVNAFYLANFLHDFFLLPGFARTAGNFQHENDAGVGRGNDPLRVVVWDVPLGGVAFFVNRPDGKSADLNLGPLGGRPSALDAGVVIHDFVHGVTSCVIGGPSVENPLRQPQSRAR